MAKSKHVPIRYHQFLWPFFKKEPTAAQEKCCIEHDLCYARGGSEDQRQCCNEEFFECLDKASEGIFNWIWRKCGMEPMFNGKESKEAFRYHDEACTCYITSSDFDEHLEYSEFERDCSSAEAPDCAGTCSVKYRTNLLGVIEYETKNFPCRNVAPQACSEVSAGPEGSSPTCCISGTWDQWSEYDMCGDDRGHFGPDECGTGEECRYRECMGPGTCIGLDGQTLYGESQLMGTQEMHCRPCEMTCGFLEICQDRMCVEKCEPEEDLGAGRSFVGPGNETIDPCMNVI